MTTTDRALSLTGSLLGGRYQVGGLLGQGGIGEVYRAHSTATGQRVAVKVLLPELSRDGTLRERFRREAQAGILLDHPNVVDTLDAGVADDGRLYLVMELIEGRSLADLIDGRELSPRRTLVLVRQLLEALAYTHGIGLLHRDLKPDNVMVQTVGGQSSAFERVRVLDFGLVKLFGEAAAEMMSTDLTATGTTFGTPGYMSPEQALGRPLDPRSDLYAVGAMLFEMLTHQRPFQAPDMMALLRLHVTQARPTLAATVGQAPWVTASIERLVRTGFERDPSARFASAAAMIEALDEAFVSLDHLPVDR